jgi:hypothetical protein
MRKHTLFLLTFLFIIFSGFSFAQQSSGSSKISPATVDQQVQKFVLSKQPITSKMIDTSKKKEIKSLIGAINSMCGHFETNPDILTSAKCTTKDSQGNLVTFNMDCSSGSCVFTKRIDQPITITQTPTAAEVQATPNVPPQSAVSTERWVKIFAGLIYVMLTVYLFMVAANNLIKREILFLIVDLSLWAALTTAMYVVLNGGL